MDEKQAKKLITKLVNAAYEAGMHSTNPDSLFVKFWKKKAEGMIDELVRHLIIQSSQPDERLKRIAKIIEAVDIRCMAVDGPVSPTLQEMTQAEISEIYRLASQQKQSNGQDEACNHDWQHFPCKPAGFTKCIKCGLYR